MKKIILCLILGLLMLPNCVFANDNFIYSINVSVDKNAPGTAVLDIKSDYMTKLKSRTDRGGREYFDIKDASLKENFAILYNNAAGVESVIAQQIGNKVRIYVKGNNIDDVKINFNNVEKQPYPDKSAGYTLLIFAIIAFSLLRTFKKKAKRLNAKAQYLQNTVSKAVYNDLMQRRNAKQNIKSIQEYQKQRFVDKVAM